MSVTIKFRKGNSTNWTTNNSLILSSGEPGFELDTGRLKIGNGITPWSGLSYVSVIPTGFLAGSGIGINLGTNGATATISISGLNSSYISDFNEAVDDRVGSGLFVAGTGINLNYNDSGNSFTVSVTGLIANPENNRILTSRDSTTIGIDAESNLTFDGSLLSVSGNLVANTGNFSLIQLDTTNGPVTAQGQLAWNDTEGTVDIALTNTAIINIGEHEMYRARNTTSNVLYKGQAVYASGVHANGIISPNLYTADGSIREIRFMGLVYENINNNNNGYVIHFGHINNIDTRGNVASNIAVGDETWSDGDILYVHPTVAGKLTKNEPKHSIAAAIILDAASNGKLFVRPTSYGHLNDNHDVAVSGATNGQFLQYSSATDYWVPSSSGNFTTLLVNGTGVSVSGHTHTVTDITNFNSIVSGLLPTIANSGDNRLLTSTGSSIGINAESNATFNGSTMTISGNLSVSSTGDINTLKINNFYHNNLSVSTGISDSDLLLTVRNPSTSPVTEVIQGGVLRSTLLNQPSVLRFRQGTNTERLLITPASGEPIWTTDTQRFYIGNGNTVGGDFIGPGPYTYSTSGINNIIVLNSTNSIGASGQNYNTISNGLNNAISFQSGIYNSIYNGTGNSITSTGNILFFGGVLGSNIIVNGRNNNISEGIHSTVLNGANNSISGSTNVILGGLPFTNSTTNHAVSGSDNLVGIGQVAAITGFKNTILNGGTHSFFGRFPNLINSTYSTIINGYNNTIRSSVTGVATTGADSSLSYIGGGVSNTVDIACLNSSINGGSLNTISSGSYPLSTTIQPFGTFNNVYPYQTIGGGRQNTSSAPYSSIPGGFNAKTTRYSELSHAAGRFASNGDAQHTILIARAVTTDSTANQELFLNGSSLISGESTYQKLTIPNKTSWVFSIKLTAYCDTNDSAAWWIFRGGIKNSTGTTSLIGSLIKEYGQDTGLSLTDANIQANDTDDSLSILVTGENSKNIRWVAVIDISQVSYGTP